MKYMKLSSFLMFGSLLCAQSPQKSLDAALITAIQNDDLVTLKSLVKKGVNPLPDYDKQTGHSLFAEAVLRGYLDIVQWYLDNVPSISIDQEFIAGNPVLKVAVYKNYPHIVEYFLDKHANVNIRGTGGATALHDAVRTRNPEMIKLLMRYKANPNLSASQWIESKGWINVTPVQLAQLLKFDELIPLIKTNN